MATHASQSHAATHFQVSPKTIARWIGEGYIHGYADGSGAVLVDLDEIERILPTNPHMRDGRRSRYGSKARIVPLPVKVEAIIEGGDAK